MNYTLIGFIVYLALVLTVGFITYRINKSHSDFFLAGRKLNPWVVAFSERASGESAWLLLGLPGAALAAGFIAAWDALGCVLGIIFYWLVIAKDLRNESERVNAITLPNFFAEKLGDGKKIIRFTATLIIVFFFTFYLAAQFNGAGKVLDVTFGIPVFWGIVLGAVVIIFYTMMGGFFAVAWTDLIQGIIMIGALVILPVIGVIELANDGYSLTDAVKDCWWGNGMGCRRGCSKRIKLVFWIYGTAPFAYTVYGDQRPGKVKDQQKNCICLGYPCFCRRYGNWINRAFNVWKRIV
jgi:sodium/proline symporter